MFKQGDLLFFWNKTTQIKPNEIIIVLEVQKLSIGKYYYLCMFPDKTIESVSESWLYNLDELYTPIYKEYNL